MNDELIDCLKCLNISIDINEVTKKDVNHAFKKLARVLHPDKSGDESTKNAFQERLKSFVL